MRLTPAPLPNFPATKHGFQLGGGREATRKYGEVKTLPWRPRTHVIMTVAIVAAVVVACHAADIPPRCPCDSRSPFAICTLYVAEEPVFCLLMQAIPGNIWKCAKSIQKSEGGHQSVHQARTAAFFALSSVSNICMGRALPIPATVHVLGCDETLASRSTGGQVWHLGQGMHTAVTSRVHCPRFKFKDVARDSSSGLEA